MNTGNTESPGKCGGCSGFNYCLWAKLIVGIPAIILVASVAAMHFQHGWAQLLAAGAVTGLMVYLAIKIDQIPALSKKIVNRKPK